MTKEAIPTQSLFPELSPEQEQELLRRAKQAELNPEAGRSWEEVKRRIIGREIEVEEVEIATDPEIEAAWDAEIRERIRAIDERRVTGVAYEDLMREEENRLAS